MEPGNGELTPFRAAVLAGPLGAVMLLGGPARVSGPSFTTVRDTGGETVWGIGFLILALLLLSAGHWQPRRPGILFHAYCAAATGYGLFVVALISAAHQQETAALTGIVVYSWVIYLHMLAAIKLPPGWVGRIALRRLARRESKRGTL